MKLISVNMDAKEGKSYPTVAAGKNPVHLDIPAFKEASDNSTIPNTVLAEVRSHSASVGSNPKIDSGILSGYLFGMFRCLSVMVSVAHLLAGLLYIGVSFTAIYNYLFNVEEGTAGTRHIPGYLTGFDLFGIGEVCFLASLFALLGLYEPSVLWMMASSSLMLTAGLLFGLRLGSPVEKVGEYTLYLSRGQWFQTCLFPNGTAPAEGAPMEEFKRACKATAQQNLAMVLLSGLNFTGVAVLTLTWMLLLLHWHQKKRRSVRISALAV
ncbi:hypothetical protein RvY_18414 [Ramazzottius varieornatus]|uniref:Uncharacterized protein n=1 Tax=Ramazzottius varieornatus TaxID=947166 RepID=A0A1D1W8Y0_RAMVA|nr:hypothetical protein RvY_18414 [Ramazzottius varieornatus]